MGEFATWKPSLAHALLVTRFLRKLAAPVVICAIAATLPASAAAGAPSAPLMRAGITYATGSSQSRVATSGGVGVNMTFHGGQMGFNSTGVLTPPHMYISFWGSAWNSDAATMNAVTTFAKNLGGSSWGQTMTQYCGLPTAPSCTPSGGVGNAPGQLAGSFVDVASDPTPGFLDTPGTWSGALSGTGGAVDRAMAHFGAPDPNANYVIMTPNNQNPSWFGSNICAYHFSKQTGPQSIATFSVVPYVASLPGCRGGGGVSGAFDAFSVSIAHEYAESIANPDGICGWSDATGTCPGTVTTNPAALGGEIGDKCAPIAAGPVNLGGKNYALPYLWSNRDNGCVLTAGPPSAPVSVSAVPGNAKATVSWQPPASDGGSPITGYRVNVVPSVPASPISEPAVTAATITGLTNGTAYTFTVSALNATGLSPDSVASSPVTPAAPQIFPGGGFTPVTPYRVLDTRLSSSTLGPGRTLTLPIAGTGGTPGGSPVVPASATGVVLNVTAVNPSASGYLTVWPSGAPRPTASNLNFTPGAIVPNLVEVALGGGAVSIFNFAGTTDVLADVAGYTSSSGDGYTALTPSRLLDTRNPGGTPIGQGGQLALTVAGGLVPATASGVVLNVTVTNPTANSFLTVWPTGSPRPPVSNLNFSAGQTVPNRVQVKLGQAAAVSLFNLAGSVDVIVDLNGYFAPGPGAVFTGVTPTRYLDTRSSGQTLSGHVALNLTVTSGDAVIPANAKAVVLNVTVVAGNSGYLTAYPAGGPAPTASDLNFSAGQVVPNLVVVAVGAGGQIAFFNLAGPTEVIVDVLGWYT